MTNAKFANIDVNNTKKISWKTKYLTSKNIYNKFESSAMYTICSMFFNASHFRKPLW